MYLTVMAGCLPTSHIFILPGCVPNVPPFILKKIAGFRPQFFCSRKIFSERHTLALAVCRTSPEDFCPLAIAPPCRAYSLGVPNAAGGFISGLQNSYPEPAFPAQAAKSSSRKSPSFVTSSAASIGTNRTLVPQRLHMGKVVPAMMITTCGIR